MSLFPNSRSKRRSAFAVLLVWLFALAAGWANACVLRNNHAHLHGSRDDATLLAPAPHLSPGHVGLDSDHPGSGDAAKRSCLKVCDDGAQTIVKSASPVDLMDIAMAPPTILSWSARRFEAVLVWTWPELSAPSPGLPLRTRYSRLAL